jgi:hypothetical protein
MSPATRGFRRLSPTPVEVIYVSWYRLPTAYARRLQKSANTCIKWPKRGITSVNRCRYRCLSVAVTLHSGVDSGYNFLCCVQQSCYPKEPVWEFPCTNMVEVALDARGGNAVAFSMVLWPRGCLPLKRTLSKRYGSLRQSSDLQPATKSFMCFLSVSFHTVVS